MANKIIVHYPRDGVIYMKGECGSFSLSSTKNIDEVTCEVCRAWLDQQKAIEKILANNDY
jgi:hypothetical protein